MPHYETVLVLRQDLSSSQAENIALRTQQELKKAQATIDRAESWGLRTLAYPIRKNRKGHYFIINHSNESQATQEMQRILRLNEDLLRILTVTTVQPQTQPTPIAAAQAQREQGTTSRPTASHETSKTTYTKTADASHETSKAADTKTADAQEDSAPNTVSETNDTQETS